VVLLAALDKISFKIEVPEQVVVLDPNLSEKDEEYVRMVTRYKQLLQGHAEFESSSRMKEMFRKERIKADDENVGLQKGAKSPDLVSDKSEKERQNVGQKPIEEVKKGRKGVKNPDFVSDKSSFQEEPPEKRSRLGRQNDEMADKSVGQNDEMTDKSVGQIEENHPEILGGEKPKKKVCFDDEVIFCPVSTESTSSSLSDSLSDKSHIQVAKSASRLALYMMREELKDEDNNIKVTQHAHDFFVIASCKIHAKMTSELVLSNEVILEPVVELCDDFR
jgi:DNA-binding transcriptional regulator of glucitol operon